MYDFKNLDKFENYNYFQPPYGKILNKKYNYYLITTNEPIQLTYYNSIDDKMNVLDSTLFGYEFNKYKLKEVYCPINKHFCIKINVPKVCKDFYGLLNATYYNYNNINYYTYNCPLKEDMIPFLTMLIQKNIHIICVLTNLYYNHKKTNKWYPQNNDKVSGVLDENFRKSYGFYNLDFISSEEIELSLQESITIYDICLWVGIHTPLYCHHLRIYQYNNWVDGSIPELETYTKYVDLIQ